jgi:hypothetical protein
MKSIEQRFAVIVAIAIVSWLALAGASAPKPAQPDKLIILSTTDVKGKTSPCG